MQTLSGKHTSFPTMPPQFQNLLRDILKRQFYVIHYDEAHGCIQMPKIPIKLGLTSTSAPCPATKPGYLIGRRLPCCSCTPRVVGRRMRYRTPPQLVWIGTQCGAAQVSQKHPRAKMRVAVTRFEPRRFEWLDRNLRNGSFPGPVLRRTDSPPAVPVPIPMLQLHSPCRGTSNAL